MLFIGKFPPKLKSGSFEPLIRGKGGREKLSGKAMQI